MKKDIFVAVLGVIIGLLVMSVFNTLRQPENIVETITEIDTVYVETTKTIPIHITEFVPEIIYLDTDSYIAKADTTIIEDKVKLDLKTAFTHPDKKFSFDFTFDVKQDSIYIYETQYITKTELLKQKHKFVAPYIGVDFIKTNKFEDESDANDFLINSKIGILLKNKLGIHLIATSDLSLGIGLQVQF